MTTTLNTKCGQIIGNDKTTYNEFLGIRYARAKRFGYASPVDAWEGTYDATSFGPSCPQTRTYYEHLEIPERLFYHNEFRKGITFPYSEDCLNLNIYQPKNASNCPVIIFIHGGGFNSGSSMEDSFDGRAYAERNVILVSIHYRVGILGYFTHEEVYEENGYDGNFGLDDQLTAIKWVKRHIADFGGDPDNITLMGQSAGAISIQYLCLSPQAEGLFKHAIMCSGAGLFPKFALPRPVENTHEYWLDYMNIAGVKALDELRAMEVSKLFDHIETIKSRRKDNTYNTMPVIDDYLITDSIDKLIDKPMPIDYMVGYTNNDMYAFLMAKIGHAYSKKNKAYEYFFDIDAPGPDKNGAFHSSDLRYIFGTLSGSHRPYSDHDYEVSNVMIDYICAFASTGNPNHTGLPLWQPGGKPLRISPKGIKMANPNQLKLLVNTLTKGDPK